MFPSLIGTVVIAGIVGYLSERWEFTRNGVLQSIIICVGGGNGTGNRVIYENTITVICHRGLYVRR